MILPPKKSRILLLLVCFQYIKASTHLEWYFELSCRSDMWKGAP